MAPAVLYPCASFVSTLETVVAKSPLYGSIKTSSGHALHSPCSNGENCTFRNLVRSYRAVVFVAYWILGHMRLSSLCRIQVQNTFTAGASLQADYTPSSWCVRCAAMSSSCLWWCAGISRVGLKSLVESVRLQTLSRAGLQQLQLDVHYLRPLLRRLANPPPPPCPPPSSPLPICGLASP